MRIYCFGCEFENGSLIEAHHHCSICGENFCDLCFKWHVNQDNSSCNLENKKLDE